MRRVWLLGREDWDYDEYDGHVVVAINEVDARRAAYDASGFIHKGKYPHDSRETRWLDPAQTTCVEITLNSRSRKAQVILSSFRAG